MVRKLSYTVVNGDVVKDSLNLSHPPVGIDVLDVSNKCIVSAVPPDINSRPIYVDELDESIRGKNVSDDVLSKLVRDGHIEKKSI